jgi:hypothetical protein
MYAQVDVQAFCNTALIIIIARSSIKACEMAVKRLMRAPTSFLDRTPNGRIVSRLCKGRSILPKTIPKWR